ncbi:MAG TPA: cbb3-type cytochrome c oxidase subunit I [Thermodesulfovibrionales bacterium]|nr:cbb3-type cytochrome c oxidase subunit I [Thermodesulfovibrionales bacterium]
MDRFVKNFIVMSIVYLAIASVLGICMLANPPLMHLKFVHSHLNMLGWVSMMIFGVGYHILPRFAGKPLKSPKMGEVQFWLANIGLVGMLVFYVLENTALSSAFGVVEAFSIFLFFYNMLGTLLAKPAV